MKNAPGSKGKRGGTDYKNGWHWRLFPDGEARVASVNLLLGKKVSGYY
jgi:hypothetical protein